MMAIFFSLDIQLKDNDIATLVESLGFALTSPEIELRAKSTKLLSETLSHLPSNFLSTTQLNFIGTFYCDRLKDHHSVMPGVFSGILTIAHMDNLPDGIASRILQSFFQHVSCQSQIREDRLKIFNILKSFSETQMLGT